MENPVDCVAEERVCSGTEYPVSWVGCPELLKLKVKSKGEAILSFMIRDSASIEQGACCLSLLISEGVV
jgi:hypothetical protein